MHLSCYSEDSLEAASDERNEEQSSPIESPAKRPRNSEDEDQNKFSKLLGDIFETDTVPPRLALVEKVRRELSMTKLSMQIIWTVIHLSGGMTGNIHTYPLITKLVKKMFSVVATSVPSDRLFSCAGNIISERSSCLLPENADKLIFLHENITDNDM